ncbi:MAG: condensation domain-containing protein [Bryobacterales bacterium]
MSSPQVHGAEAELQEESSVSGDVYAFPLSPAQRRLWFVEQLKPGTPVYNIPSAFRLTGNLNRAALEQSLRAVVQRHDSLRTTFETIDGEPTQIVRDEIGEFFEAIDLRELPEREREERAREIVDNEAAKSFDLVEGPLIRVKLALLDETTHVLVINQHHLITDGWSLGVFAEEVAELYRSFAANTPHALEELSLQYPDFAVWQRDWLTPERMQPQLDYWRNALAGSAPLLELPTDHPRPQNPINRGSWTPFETSKELTEGLKTLSRQNGVSLFTTMLAGFKALLARYTRQKDVMVGTPAANRERPELERIIGFFINPIVLRTDLSGDPTVSELLRRVNTSTQGALANQEIPFDKLVEEIRPVRDLSYHPLFQVMFTLQNSPLRIQLDGVQAEPIAFDNGTSKFDLLIELWEEHGSVRGRFEFDTDLFLKSTVQDLVRHYQTLLESMVDNPSAPVSRLRLLTDEEERRLLTDWNATEEPALESQDFFARFEAAAAKYPDQTAVSDDTGSWTYAELRARSASLAARLRALGVGKDSIVGISLDRTRDLIACVAAVIAAGAAYAPIDPNYPDERRAYMLQDSNAHVVLTCARYADQFNDFQGQTLLVDKQPELFADRDAKTLMRRRSRMTWPT